MKRSYTRFTATLIAVILFLTNAAPAGASSSGYTDAAAGGQSSSVCEGAIIAPCKVTYDANGGSGGLAVTGLVPGAAYTVLAQAQTGVIRNGYAFTGWNTAANGSGSAYTAGQQTTVTQGLILYAQWVNVTTPPPQTFQVTYDANGGTGGRVVTGLVSGTSHTVLSPSQSGVSRSGYIFIGWNTRAGGTGVSYASGQQVTISGNVVFYAQWDEQRGTEDGEISPTPPGPSNPPDPSDPPEQGNYHDILHSPSPISHGSVLVPQDDGSYLDMDDRGNTIGRWTLNGDEWVFAPNEPFPKTGVDNTAPWWSFGLCLSFILLMLLMLKRRAQSAKRGVKNDHSRDFLLFMVICLLSAVLCARGLIQDIGERAEGRNYYAELAAVAGGPERAQAKAAHTLPGPEPNGSQTADAPPVNLVSRRMDVPGLSAWLSCEGTVIDYPVMQGTDNTYYLNHLPDGTKNKMGALFLDYRNAPGFSDRNSVIYGHHMNSGDMFGALKDYKTQAFYDDHPVMRLSAPGKEYRIELFAGYLFDPARERLPLDFTDAGGFAEFVADVRARSLFTSEVAVGPGDRLICLATCSYEFPDARFILVGRLVEEGVTAS